MAKQINLYRHSERHRYCYSLSNPVILPGGIYMYICCKCGLGPQVFEDSSACRQCGHAICQHCDHIPRT
ncbi:hypothetical protein DTO212C5_229 [Paecilomyces variotii]|nr:hypothetical protein DTO212C5_229 [Paecilomyces variotii]